MKIVSTALFSIAAFAQTPATFEIADVHPSAATLHPAMRFSLRAGRCEITNATMLDLIAAAWGVEPDKVSAGPSWLELDRFDVIAKLPGGTSATTPQTLRPLLQALLAERFGLTIHTDQRPMAAFVLSVGKGRPKLKESTASGSPGCQRAAQAPESTTIPADCHGLTTSTFAQQLRGMAGDYVQTAVIDSTNLEGTWDFSLKWTPRARLAAAGSDGITIFDAIDTQLGLKLESKLVPTPVIVVDSVNRKPKDNPPGVTTSLPPAPPPQFEVATIKPTDPQFPGVRIQTPPNGQVAIQGVTLGYLIQTIWFVTPEMIAGAPKWLDTDQWDIAAKVATTPGSAPPTDMDSMIAMVRTLLEDRFQLKTHIEERVVPAYTLTSAKPRLRKAEPATRTACKEGPGIGPDGVPAKDPRLANPALSRLVSCQNITMAQFSQFLPNIANALNPLNGYLRSPVLDSTGLTEAYDFTLNFSPMLGIGPAVTSPQPLQQTGATDPNGSLSIAEAIDRQLGLKLEMQKRPAPVLVIDHIEQTPSAN